MSVYFGRARIFLILCGSFVAGVFVSPYLTGLFVYFIAFAAIFFVALISVFWDQRRFVIAGFAGLFLLMGVWRFQSALPDMSSPDFIGSRYGQTMTLTGVVWEDPDVRQTKTNLVIKPDNHDGKILLNVGRYPEYEYGQRLEISGEIEEPFETDEFSYKNYLSRFGIFALMSFPKVETVGENEGRFYKSALLAVKHRFKSTLSQLLPEPHNAFLLGLLLGLKKAIPEDLNHAFIISGVSHIVVVSGYNISIITRNLLKTRLVWGRRVAFALSILAVLAFVVLTGAEASVVRASVMGLLLVFAMNIGRVYQVINALVITGSVMVFLNPQILHFDIGFQLSFLATLGLIWLAPLFDKWFRRLPDILGVRTNLSSTLAAQVFTLPFLIFYFDRLSLVAPVVNVLILWAIPYTMLFGFASGLLGLVFVPMAKIFAVVPWMFLEFMIRIVEAFSQIPFASVQFSVTWWMLGIYYFLMVGALLWYRIRHKFFHQLEYFEAKV